MNYRRSCFGFGLHHPVAWMRRGSVVQATSRLDRYVSCNIESAMQRASWAGDPATLAIEAEASCADERQALERVYQRTVGPEQARELLYGIRQAAIASNAATIIANGAR